jgi:molybdate transport system regulatory protein
MPRSAKARRSRPLKIQPRVKLWLELDGERAFCPGVCRILEEVERTGSIKEAAAAIDRSYRFVWGKLKEIERAIDCSLVETRVGGSQEQRSVLTDTGRALVQEFTALRRRLFDVMDREYAPRLQAALGARAAARRG